MQNRSGSSEKHYGGIIVSTWLAANGSVGGAGYRSSMSELDIHRRLTRQTSAFLGPFKASTLAQGSRCQGWVDRT